MRKKEKSRWRKKEVNGVYIPIPERAGTAIESRRAKPEKKRVKEMARGNMGSTHQMKEERRVPKRKKKKRP